MSFGTTFLHRSDCTSVSLSLEPGLCIEVAVAFILLSLMKTPCKEVDVNFNSLSLVQVFCTDVTKFSTQVTVGFKSPSVQAFCPLVAQYP